MTEKCVVRNAQYRRGGLNKRERHNERKNAGYQNEDIVKERAAAITAVVEQKQEAAAALDEQTVKKKRQLDGLEKKTAAAKQEAADFEDIDRIS